MKTFVFTQENIQLAKEALAKYPKERGKSAVMELLWIAQRQNQNWIPEAAIVYIADFLEIPNVRVFELATFYSMYNLKPVGKYFLQVCGTTPCMLMGAEDIMSAIQKELKIQNGEITEDKLFSLLEVECLGACSNGPMIQINDDYYEDLTPEIMKEIIANLKAGKAIKIGSQKGRKSAETKELL
ncbi:MAG: NADH-quinone oxidoreductase E subunit [Candidatus Deianiraeaceae bacterium]|jgi:NADH-quinone oxidoreductase E subunit